MRRARSDVSGYSIICQSSCSNKAAERVRVRLPNIGVGNVCDKHRGWTVVNTRRQLSRAPPEPSTVAAPQSRARCCLPCRGPCCVRACWHACQLYVCLCVFVWDSDVAGVLEDPAGRTSLHDSNYRYLFRPLLQSITDSIPKILFYLIMRLINLKMELLFMFLKPKWCCYSNLSPDHWYFYFKSSSNLSMV